jgi:hypothetical protein
MLTAAGIYFLSSILSQMRKLILLLWLCATIAARAGTYAYDQGYKGDICRYQMYDQPMEDHVEGKTRLAYWYFCVNCHDTGRTQPLI